MDNAVKKVASYILIVVVLISTFIAILSVWGLVDLEDVIWKIMQTLFVVFIAAILVLFIYNILLREPFKKKDSD
jgi:membrane protein YdbS with pleckstrin-like domain